MIGPTESILTQRGNRFPDLATFFNENGYEVLYFTSNFYHYEKRFFTYKEIKNAKGKLNYKLIVINSLGYYKNISVRRVINNFAFSLILFFRLFKIVKKGDRIIIPSRPIELIFFTSLIKTLKGIKIYLDIQDIWPDALSIENKFKKYIFIVYCNFFLKNSLKKYTSTIHIAPSFRIWLNRYAPGTESRFIPLGWENDRWGRVSNNFNRINGAIKIVCIAQLQYQIDIMPLLEVLKINDSIHLTVIGENGKGERYDEVASYIKKYKINNIDIIGSVSRKEIVELLCDKDVGILPMITTSIPNKIFDYLAAALPIIVLGNNDSSNFVLDNDIGWRSDFHSKDLEKLFNNLNLNEIKLKRQNIIKIRDQYSRNILHEKIRVLIDK